MKAKLILCLSFIVSAILSGCSTTTPHAPTAATESKVLYTCMYQYNGDAFGDNLDKETHWKKKMMAAEKARPHGGIMYGADTVGYFSPIVGGALRKVLADAGANSNSPNALFVNDRLAMVCFHGTKLECKIVERVIEKLNDKPFIKMTF